MATLPDKPVQSAQQQYASIVLWKIFLARIKRPLPGSETGLTLHIKSLCLLIFIYWILFTPVLQ
jgi:hypothetical protein